MVAERSIVPMGPQTIVNVEERDRLLRRLILPEASPEQFQLVVAICQRYGFDPLLRHVLIISNNLYVTRDGLRHMAWLSGEFDGYDPPEERKDENGKWIVTVRVYRKGITRPFTATAYQSESENSKSPVWRNHPRLMTGKVAEVIALRMAFGVSLGGAEEIGFDGSSSETTIGTARFIETETTEVRPAKAVPQQSARPAVAVEAEIVEAPRDAENFGWTEFWAWARARGYGDRKSLDAKLGKPTNGMTPWEIYQGLLALEQPTAAVAPVEQTPQTLAEKVDAMLDWLSAEPRSLKQQETLLKKLFALTDDQEHLLAFRALAKSIAHQDALDGAWHDRMIDLGRPVDAVPAIKVEAEPEDPFGAGQPASYAG
jgi:hypothetical protein